MDARVKLEEVRRVGAGDIVRTVEVSGPSVAECCRWAFDRDTRAWLEGDQPPGTVSGPAIYGGDSERAARAIAEAAAKQAQKATV